MRVILNNISYRSDAPKVTYKRSMSDPVPTCRIELKDSNSSIVVKELQELLILDDKVIPNPTTNLLVNPTLNPYNTFWSAQSYSGITLTQQNQSIATLTTYLANAASAVLPGATGDQLYFNSGTPTVTHTFSQIGNNVLGWGQLTAQGSLVWAGSLLPGSPDGRGFLLDPTFLQGETMQAGDYTPKIPLNAAQGSGVAAGTLVGDILCRIWKWNSVTNTYTFIASSTLTNQTVNSSVVTYTLPNANSALAVAYGPNEYQYQEYWFHCTTNGNGVANQGIQINNLSTDSVGKTGDVSTALITPGPIVPPALLIQTNNAGVGTDPILENYCIQNQIVPGQAYMLSAYFQFGSTDPNVGGFIQINWYDAAQNFLSNAYYFGPKPGSLSLARYSLQSTAPANAVFMKAWFGVSVTNATNACSITLSNVQFEPVWFSDITYPTPFCGPNQPNCVQLLNTLGWIRQKRKFAGLVNHALPGNYIGNSRTIQVDAVGYAWLWGFTFTATQFVNTLDSTIISSLMNAYFSALFNVGSGVVDGVTLANLQPNWDDLRTIFSGLCAQSAYFGGVDDYWNVLYQPPGWTTMPYGLLADNSANPDNITTFPVYKFSAEPDFTQPGCAVLVIGGTPANTALTSALTSGSNYTTLSVNALTQALPNGLICSLGGQQGVTLSADAAIGATTLTIFSFHALNNYAIGATVTPNPLTALVIDPVQTANYSNQLSGYGNPGQFFMRKVTDATLDSISDCTQRGIAEILQYNQSRTAYHGTTNVELIPGQGIAVTSNTEGLSNSVLLIQQMTAQWIGTDETLHDVWEYTADFGATYRNATNILSHIFRRTTRNATAPPVVQTGLVVIERLGLSDGPPSAYALLAFASNPFSYFRLGESAGAIAYDVTNNGGNGSITGGVTLGVPGLIYQDPNTAMSFDGSTGEITTAVTITNFASSAFSVSGWFTLSTLSFSSVALAADSQSNIDNKGFQVLVKSIGVEFDLGGIAGLAVSTLWVVGQRYRLTGTYDGATMSIYLNGVLIGSRAASGALVAPVHTMAIGYNPATSSGFFPGVIDEVMTNASALTAAQELALYNAGVSLRR